MLRLTLINIFLSLCILTSCGGENTEQKKCYASYELVGTQQDTVNLIDCDKNRQGIWVPSPGNDLKDTLFYKNGEVVKN